jgi:hypothetical protein
MSKNWLIGERQTAVLGRIDGKYLLGLFRPPILSAGWYMLALTQPDLASFQSRTVFPDWSLSFLIPQRCVLFATY